MNKLLFRHNDDWSFETMMETYTAVQQIVDSEMKISYYPNQIEVVSAEQMLDAYSTVGLPIYYDHWSFGKEYEHNTKQYKGGQMGLAYELVINSNPCISYNMESNSATMMALVVAHAAFGHNAVFKNNYMFTQWTDASAIIDYMVFARKFIQQCEERYGADEVELTLDACHALQQYGVDKYKRTKSKETDEEKEIRRKQDALDAFDDVWYRTVTPAKVADERLKTMEPQENILYFLEKNSPVLTEWQREIVRIVRKIAQYFYPQAQTKVLNEGFATFTHYYVMNRLHQTGQIDNGSYLEFIASHTNVVCQPAYNSKYYSGINPYALGFAIFNDLYRICTAPTDEDRQWFPKIIGRPWNEVLVEAMINYKDDSFIQQWLSPKVIRDLSLFVIHDDYRDSEYEVSAIHNDAGYEKVRTALARQYNRSSYVPDIQVTNANMDSDRTLVLTHFEQNDIPMDEETATRTLQYVQYLWGFDTRLETIMLGPAGVRNHDLLIKAG